MNLKHRPNILLLTFIALSLLLHLVFLTLMPQRGLFPTPEKKPVYVEVRPQERRDRELDIPNPENPSEPRKTPAKRLGPADQVVQREQAPKGKDLEDMSPPARPPAPAVAAPKPAQKPAPDKVASLPRHTLERVPETSPRGTRPVQSVTAPRTTPEVPPSTAAPPLPDLASLLTLPQATVERLEKTWRKKYRAEVEEGDAVWLDTEKDILISFFQRFKRNIYMVWNYPDQAKMLEQEGTCLLKIVINRDGSVKDVEVKEASRFPILDNEAVRAVRRGGPYGHLPRAYQGEELKILAFFRYDLVNRAVY